MISENGLDLSMPVAPAYGNNGGFGFGGDWGWIILLLLFAGGGGWGMGGFGGGFGGMYEFPWLFNGQQGINANTNAGFRDAMLNDGITSIRDGISGISTQLCGCCSDMQMAVANGFAGVEAGANARQMANMQTAFNLQSQLAECCCENRLATNDLKFTIANEACATRENSTANTQAILDKLCQLELDGYKRENDQLRSQLQFANMQASQVAQTAELKTAGATTANQLVAELRSCPIPAQPVYGNTPIFSCNNSSCGCGM